MLKMPLLSAALLAPLNCVDISIPIGCTDEEPRDASIDASGISEIVVRAAAGELRIEGRPGASSIDIEGKACASRRQDLDEIELRAERVGDRAVIEAILGEDRRNRYRRLDLDILVPDNVPLVVEDRSGDIEITHVASVELTDSSGDVEISDVAGDVTVDDGSGELSLRRISGAVRVQDGSGDVEIADAGAVVIERDGSGDIEIEDIATDVEIERDGAGDIDIFTVGGDLTIDSAGSGDLDYENVEGDIDVPRDRRRR